MLFKARFNGLRNFQARDSLCSLSKHNPGGITMYKLVLIRHGESIWNKENKFTGWTDVDLSEKGVVEAS